jgi:hypothetical protein
MVTRYGNRHGGSEEKPMKTLNTKRTGLLTFALGAALTGVTTGGAQAQSATNGYAPRLVLNGQPFQTRTEPVLQDGRVLVPLRDIFEELGARVNYDNYNRTITAHRDGTRVQMILGSARARVDGRPVRLDVPAMSVRGRTMVPLRRNVVRINDRDRDMGRGLDRDRDGGRDRGLDRNRNWDRDRPRLNFG